MIKKSSGQSQSQRQSVPKRRKSLDIRQIRAFVDELTAAPDDAPLPDWSHLTIGDRFAIAVRLVPPERLPVLGKSEGHIRRYEQGVDIPLTVVAALAAETKIPLEWIVSGRATDRRPPLVMITPEQPAADLDDVPLQKLSFKVAAGRGSLILDELADYVRFPRAILAHVGLAPEHARLMEASGESMRPTINDGDLMLVDISKAVAQIVEGKIYVFAIGNEAYVKRLRRAGAKVIMISDNREMFPPEDAPEEPPMTIYGMVRWAGRSL